MNTQGLEVNIEYNKFIKESIIIIYYKRGVYMKDFFKNEWQLFLNDIQIDFAFMEISG